MDTEQDEKAMGVNMLAIVEPQKPPIPKPDDTEAAIAGALSSQDFRKAVELSASAYGSAVGRLCMAMVGSLAEAQELAQETFITAHSAFASYRAEGTVRAYLFGIARRVCSRHIEMRARREARLRLIQGGDGASSDVVEKLALEQAASRARIALDKLRPSERDAVVLRFQAGLSFREVAEACGIDEPTARKRVSRAIAHLRDAIGDS